MQRNLAGAQVRASHGDFVPSGSGAWYSVSRWRFAAFRDGGLLGMRDRHERCPPVQLCCAVSYFGRMFGAIVRALKCAQVKAALCRRVAVLAPAFLMAFCCVGHGQDSGIGGVLHR